MTYIIFAYLYRGQSPASSLSTIKPIVQPLAKPLDEPLAKLFAKAFEKPLEALSRDGVRRVVTARRTT